MLEAIFVDFQTYLASLQNNTVALYVLEERAFVNTGPVAQRITRLTTDQKIAGSNPAWIVTFTFELIFSLDKFVRFHSCL